MKIFILSLLISNLYASDEICFLKLKQFLSFQSENQSSIRLPIVFSQRVDDFEITPTELGEISAAISKISPLNPEAEECLSHFSKEAFVPLALSLRDLKNAKSLNDQFDILSKKFGKPAICSLAKAPCSVFKFDTFCNR